MKNLEMNKTAKRILVGGVLAAALVFTAQSKVLANNERTLANVKAEEDKTLNAENTSVNYIGIQSNSFMFHVNLNNVASNSIVLTITDQTGEVLYSTKVENKDYNKTFAVPQDLGVEKINFIVTTSAAQKDGSVTTNRVKTYSMSSLYAK